MNMRLLGVGLVILTAGTVVWAQTDGTPAAGAATAANAAASASASAPAATSAFKTEKERMGYSLGLQLGGRLEGIDIDYASIAAGIKDSATNAKSLLTDKEIEENMRNLQSLVMAQMALIPEKNQKAGDTFLAENGKKDGVKTTASGLEYKVIKSGAGKSPKATDTVSVNYRGTLISGREFDASDDKPVSFEVGGVIPGWTEALLLMKEGDKWQLFIPAKLAYGSNPPPGAPIGPNEVLVFEVELLLVK